MCSSCSFITHTRNNYYICSYCNQTKHTCQWRCTCSWTASCSKSEAYHKRHFPFSSIIKQKPYTKHYICLFKYCCLSVYKKIFFKIIFCLFKFNDCQFTLRCCSTEFICLASCCNTGYKSAMTVSIFFWNIFIRIPAVRLCFECCIYLFISKHSPIFVYTANIIASALLTFCIIPLTRLVPYYSYTADIWAFLECFMCIIYSGINNSHNYTLSADIKKRLV